MTGLAGEREERERQAVRLSPLDSDDMDPVFPLGVRALLAVVLGVVVARFVVRPLLFSS